MHSKLRALPIVGKMIRKIVEPPLPSAANFEILSLLDDDDFAKTVKDYSHPSSPSINRLRRNLEVSDEKTNISLSEIFLATLKEKKISPTSAVAMILNEFVGHACLLDINYQRLPIPLRSGLIVILAKTGPNIEVGGIEVFSVPDNLDSIWQACIRSYIKCRNLPHRSQPIKDDMERLLSNDLELSRAFTDCFELITSIDEYVLSLEKKSKERELRIGMGASILELCNSYQSIMKGSRNAKFSDFIIAVEMVTSFSHKIILGDRSIVLD